MPRRHVIGQLAMCLLASIHIADCFTFSHHVSLRVNSRRMERTVACNAYRPPTEDSPSTPAKKAAPVYPKVGDFVQYYDLDGGKVDGESFVGRISFISKRLASNGSPSGWQLEVTEMEDLGDGYFGDYPSRKRLSKKTVRDIASVSPVSASFVRSENAYKVPTDSKGSIITRKKAYDVDGYEGPSGQVTVNESVVAADGAAYNSLKGQLLRNAALFGIVGAVLVDLLKGFQDAVIYGLGAAAGVAYLFFLSLKTDTLASPDRKFGSNLANLRFLMPVLVILAVSLYNKSLGDANPIATDNPFDTVTPEQFAVAILGILTYRVPLFASQLVDALKGDDVTLPGSLGVAMKLGMDSPSDASEVISSATDLPTVLLISGPRYTGRSELVKTFMDQSNGTFVAPSMVDRQADGVTFERLERRGEILNVDSTGRFGLTKDSIVSSGSTSSDSEQKIVVLDADVDLAKKIASIGGIRIIGVWVGLNSLEEFQSRIKDDLQRSAEPLGEGESEESIVRARLREIISEIEYGISAGIFEFTIFNEDSSSALKELEEAAAFCMK